MMTNPDSPSLSTQRTQSQRRGAARTLAPFLVLASLAVASCASDQTLDGPTYPTLTQGATVDVQVQRDSTDIVMTNTTAKPLPAGRMWINAWFSREFPGLGVGQSLTLDLFDFKDRYNVAFNGGGFFATQRPDRVMQAQIQSGAPSAATADSAGTNITPANPAPPGELIGLVVIHSNDE